MRRGKKADGIQNNDEPLRAGQDLQIMPQGGDQDVLWVWRGHNRYEVGAECATSLRRVQTSKAGGSKEEILHKREEEAGELYRYPAEDEVVTISGQQLLVIVLALTAIVVSTIQLMRM